MKNIFQGALTVQREEIITRIFQDFVKSSHLSSHFRKQYSTRNVPLRIYYSKGFVGLHHENLSVGNKATPI